MKKIAAIGLLVLLLYNTFGLTFAILFFENDFKVASPVSQSDDWKLVKLYLPSLPYSDSWENRDGIEGLLHQDGSFYNATNILHQNDTLYVTLKSNIAAREQFLELASLMTEITDQSNVPESTHNKVLKLLSSLLKTYIPTSSETDLNISIFENLTALTHQRQTDFIFSCFEIHLNTPPPEVA